MSFADLIPLALETYNYIEGQDDARNISENANVGYDEGIKYTKDTFDPYIEKGQDALGRWDNLLADPSSITTNPGYQFGVNQGQQAMERSAASKGNLLSGKTLLDSNRWGQDYGQTYYDTALGRESDMANMGLKAGAYAAPEISAMQAGKGEALATREILQSQNRNQLMEGLTEGYYGPGGIFGGGGIGDGDWLSKGRDWLTEGGEWADAIGGIFGGAFGDDLSNLVSGSIFDPDTWGAIGLGGMAGGGSIGGAFWDGVGAVGTENLAPGTAGAWAGLGRLGYGLITGEETSGAIAAGGGAAAGAAAGAKLGALAGPWGSLGGAAIGGVLGSSLGSKLGKAIGFSGKGGGEDKIDYSLGTGESDRSYASGLSSSGVWGSVGFGHQKHMKNTDNFQTGLDALTQSDEIISEAFTDEQNAAIKVKLLEGANIGSNSNEGGFSPQRMMAAFFKHRATSISAVIGADQFASMGLDKLYAALASGDQQQIEDALAAAPAGA